MRFAPSESLLAPEKSTAVDSVLFEKINILVVDDNPAFCELVKASISSQLCNVVTAPSYEEGMNRFLYSGHLWHCIVLDHDLGGPKNGLDFLKEAGNRLPPTLFASAYGTMQIAQNALDSGALFTATKLSDFQNELCPAICRTAAFGYLTKGLKCEPLPIFRPLMDGSFRRPEEWAKQVKMSCRNLQRICLSVTGCAPLEAMHRFNATFIALLKGAKFSEEAMVAVLGKEKVMRFIDSVAFALRANKKSARRKVLSENS